MSAQALLSISAPAVPTAPQGGGDTDATAFKGLFASLLSAEAANDGDGDAAPATDPDADASDVVGFLAAPPALPMTTQTPILLTGTGESTETAEGGGTAASILPSDIEIPNTSLPVPPPPSPADADTVPPPVLPTADAASEAVVPEDAALKAAIAAQAESGKPAVQSAPAQTTPVASQPAPVPAPAPALRALAERTSEPVEAETADEPAQTDPAGSAPASKPDAATKAGKPLTPAEAAAALVGDAPKGDGGSTVPAELPGARTSEAFRLEAAAPARMSDAAVSATAQIAAQIIRRLEGRSTSFEMALTPDDLGRVDVKLDIDSEGRLAARLAFDNPAAATDLRGKADELRRQLEAQGFHLADDAFEFTQRDSGSHAFDRGQNPRDGQSRAFSAAARLNAETDTVAQPRWTTLSLTPTGVDMKV